MRYEMSTNVPVSGISRCSPRECPFRITAVAHHLVGHTCVASNRSQPSRGLCSFSASNGLFFSDLINTMLHLISLTRSTKWPMYKRSNTSLIKPLYRLVRPIFVDFDSSPSSLHRLSAIPPDPVQHAHPTISRQLSENAHTIRHLTTCRQQYRRAGSPKWSNHRPARRPFQTPTMLRQRHRSTARLQLANLQLGSLRRCS